MIVLSVVALLAMLTLLVGAVLMRRGARGRPRVRRLGIALVAIALLVQVPVAFQTVINIRELLS